MGKTNVMRVLEQKKIPYIGYENGLPIDGAVYERDIAKNGEMAPIFKTLVTVANTREHFVFVVPLDETLDLKKAAKAVKVKSIEMIKQKELLPLTGYIHGGCSPIGMKKPFVTVIDETAILYDYISVSGGKVENKVEVNPEDLAGVVGAEFLDIVVEKQN